MHHRERSTLATALVAAWIIAITPTVATAEPELVHAAASAPATHEDEEAGAVDQGAQDALGANASLRTRAEQVSFDTRRRILELDGDVRLDAGPFHLRSERLTLERTRFGIEVDGKGSVAFCPCLGTPLRIAFDHAIVAPPGDLVVRSPVVRVYDVPVFYLPYFWLRSKDKPGLLPPDVAYRGQDGLFIGGGAHLPWKLRRGDADTYALDLRAGAYVSGGFATGVRLRTPESTMSVRFDRRTGASAPPGVNDDGADTSSASEGLQVDARGSTGAGSVAQAAWDVDAIRGRRGLVATTELDAAAKPWDRASFEAALRAGHVAVATTVRAVTRRGTGLSTLDAIGPAVRLRASGAVSTAITYDATVEGGTLRRGDGFGGPMFAGVSGLDAPPTASALSFVRGELGASGVERLGPVVASVALRGIGDVAVLAEQSGMDRAASARARLALPLVRRFGQANAAVLHVVEPFVQAAALHAHGDGLLGFAPGRAMTGVDGTAPLVSAGLSTTLGRPRSSDALRVDVAAGAAGGPDLVTSVLRPIARARLASGLTWFGATFDGALVIGRTAGTSGWVTVARTRLGKVDGLRLAVNVATREGLDPVLARALSEAALEPSSGFLTRSGTTGGASLVIPWSRVVTTSAGADADAREPTLVAARAGLQLRDRCGCVTLRASGARRIGRGGFDVWVAVDIATNL